MLPPMTLRRPAQRAAGLLAFTLAVFASTSSITAHRQPQELGWTGTITVEMKADGALPGAASAIKFKGSETTTYTLRGDGTASWISTLSSATDMGGRYSIPLKGSGGGNGTAGVSFNGQGWDIGVDTDDDFPTEEDHTAEDRVMADVGPARIAVEIAKATGQPFTLEPRVEKGRTGPLIASVVSRGAANATTLTGSMSEPHESQPIGGGSGILATLTVTWNLRRTPVPPHVRIYGPECGCIVGDDTEKTLHFNAGASPSGGEFSEFVVTSTGKMPEVVTNNGGEQPSLEITGTKDTGEVTLKITYTRNGVKQTSAPFVVNFCAIEKIELDDNEHDLAFDLSGRLEVKARAKAWRGGKEISSEIEWDIEKMGEPTVLTASPENRRAEQIAFTYEFMPRKNSDFGVKKLTASTTGVCACQRDEQIRAFFIPDDSNHVDDATPNWFYYWKQTSAATPDARPLLRYKASVEDPYLPGISAAQYDGRTALIYFSDEIVTAKGCHVRYDSTTGRMILDPNADRARGIDCFAEDVRHEMQHRKDAIDWWGDPHGSYSLNGAAAELLDLDGDQMPNEVERKTPGCSPVSKFSCLGRPFPEVTDAEVFAYWTGWQWPLNSINAQDWSCGPLAKQWKGKKCGQ
jgi:hypothetical protein